MAGAIPRKSELHYCGLDSLHVVVLDDISEYYHIHMYMQRINFLYYHAVNFCVGLPLKRNIFVVSLVCTDRKGWWVDAINCVQGGVDKEFGVQILYAVICFPLYPPLRSGHTLCIAF